LLLSVGFWERLRELATHGVGARETLVLRFRPYRVVRVYRDGMRTAGPERATHIDGSGDGLRHSVFLRPYDSRCIRDCFAETTTGSDGRVTVQP
jgi:hypothetical protein